MEINFDMKDRLQAIIQKKNMTVSQFADATGIQRSTFHHIISGRNNPSLDIVTKIHATYPDINLEWLMTGEGTDGISADGNPDFNEEEGSMQTEIQFLTDESTITEKNRSLKEVTKPSLEAQPLSESATYGKKISKIIVVYTDGTTDFFEK